jgi:hypothetical protein
MRHSCRISRDSNEQLVLIGSVNQWINMVNVRTLNKTFLAPLQSVHCCVSGNSPTGTIAKAKAILPLSSDASVGLVRVDISKTSGPNSLALIGTAKISILH